IAAAPHQNNPTFSVIDGTIISYLYSILYYLIELLKQNILLIFAIPALFNSKDKNRNVVFWTILFFAAYFTIAMNKQVRFALLFLPYLSIFAAQGILSTKNNKIKTAFITIFIITFVFNAHQEYTAIKTTNEPIMEFYTFFDKLRGPILTANPIPAAYSDKLFIPFYQDIETAHEIYDAHKNTSTVAYTTEFYPCSNYADKNKCQERKKELLMKISKGREKVYSINYGQEYMIYSFPNASLISRVTKSAV
ncbi:hypothetical protein HY485_01755, partial [Candidatus Woesearchaeota archaeon]|nr:hypothetical protein [Candidatus Woesearchaeota archaeon]